MGAEPVTLDWDDNVATITVTRPKQMNALNEAALDLLETHLRSAADDDARCLVITGAGEKAFVAGADIERMQSFGTEAAQQYTEQGHRIANMIESFPAPAVAAVNGYAFGGGCELALACDLRVASERAVFGQTEIDLGIIPGWGGTQRLPALVGDEMARRMIYFGERIDATDAYERGLIGEVVAHDDLTEHISELTAELAAKPATAMRAAKEALNTAYSAPRSTGLEYEARTWSGLFGTADQREGMSAFLEDRDPEFES